MFPLRPALRHLLAAVMVFVLALQACVLPAAAQSDPVGPAPVEPASAASPDANYSLAGRVLTPANVPVAGVTVTATTSRPPLIFIPGIGGSILRKQGKDWPLWPNILEPDDKLRTVVEFFLGDLALKDTAKIVMDRMAGNASDLVLNPADGYATDVTAPDVIRWVVNAGPVKLKDVYGSFLSGLETKHGYRPYQLTYLPGEGCDASQASNKPTLYVFPYDWRLSPDESARRLAAYVDCIQSFYPNTPIDIVAHSMGGLVARSYILNKVDAGQPSHIRRMVTLGTPWLGTPKLLYVMLTGDFDFMVNLALINKDVLKQLISAYPGAHSLLPSEKYVQLGSNNVFYGAPLREWGWDLDGKNGNKDEYNYAAYKAWIDANFVESAPASTNEAFHGRTGQDNWNDDNSGVEYHHILGSATGTILKVIAKERCERRNGKCTNVQFFDPQTSPYSMIPGGNLWGDGTVPHISGDGNKVSPSASTPVQLYYTLRSLTDWDKFEHGKLPLAQDVQNCVIEILNSGGCTAAMSSAELAAAATEASAIEQYELLVVGSGAATVADGAGNLTGYVDDTAMLRNVPGVNYYDTGGNAVRITLPATELLTVTFKSGDTSLYVEVLKTSEDSIVEAVRYADLAVEPNTTLVLSLPLLDATPLSLDTSGDGIPDAPVNDAPVRVTSSLAGDVTPPTVTMKVAPDRVMTISAEDPAGITGIHYSFDNLNFAPYVAPVGVPGEAQAVYAFADDAVGNRSLISTLPLEPDTTMPATTVLVEGPQDGAGAFTGPVTVSLRATDTGSGVFKSYTSLDGGQTWQEYTAPLQIQRGEATSVQAYSVDNAGNREDPPQVRDLVFAAAQTNLYLPALQRGDVQTAVPDTSVEHSAVIAVYTATTGADGRYTFASLPAGTYEVVAQQAGWTITPAKQTVVLMGNTDNINFTATLMLTDIDDFEQYTENQMLGGQGDWVNENSCNVVVIASDSSQRGKVVRSSDCYYGQYVERPYQFGFSTDDQDIYIQFSGRITSGSGNNSSSSVILGPPAYTLSFGMGTNPSLGWNFQPAIWTSDSTYLGQPLVPDTWYDFRLEVDWSYVSSLGGYGLATLRYRPSGTTQWLTEASLTDVELDVPNPSLLSTIGLRMDGIRSRRGELDDITFGRGN